MSTRWSVLFLLLGLGCDSEAKSVAATPAAAPVVAPAPPVKPSSAACEHARDVVIKEMEDSENLLMVATDDPAVKQQRMAMLQTKTGRVRDQFVAECMKLMPEHEACIAKVDEQVAAAREQRADFVMCAARLEDGPAEVERCRKAASERANARVGACAEPLERILGAIEGAYRREQAASRPPEERKAEAKTETKTETKRVEAKTEAKTETRAP